MDDIKVIILDNNDNRAVLSFDNKEAALELFELIKKLICFKILNDYFMPCNVTCNNTILTDI
jgi:hypothetical protein